MSVKPIVELESGWQNVLKTKAIARLHRFLDDESTRESGPLFAHDEYVKYYSMCYDMCTQRTPFNWSDPLYQRHESTCSEYLRGTVLPAVQGKGDDGTIFLLKELDHRWDNHLLMSKWMGKFFMYLDRYHVKHHTLDSLGEVGLKLFKTIVFEEIKVTVTNTIIDMINKERKGEVINRDIIKKMIVIYETMGLGELDIYTNDFEQKFLIKSREEFSERSNSWLESDTTPEYMIKAEKALLAESECVKAYLNNSTEPKLLKVVEDELLLKVQNDLLTAPTGCTALLANDKHEDLNRMFNLFNRLENGLQPMADIFKTFVETLGMDLITKRETKFEESDEKQKGEDPDFIRAVLAIHDKNRALVADHFGDHGVFLKALTEAFKVFMNRNVGDHSNAELMVSFCDRLLKPGEKMSDEDISADLQKMVVLLSYLEDKDRFKEIYKNMLSKRLLGQSSASDDLEREMISNMKLDNGATFTSNFEGMMSDMMTCKDKDGEFSKKKYEAHLKKSMKEGEEMPTMELNCQVLTGGNWPSEGKQLETLNIPDEMQQAVESFKQFYFGCQESRKLAFNFYQGNATVKGTFGEGKKKKTYDMSVSTLQASALALFGDGASLDYGDVKSKLGINDDVARPLLHSLSCGKYKVLMKTPMSKKIKESDNFRANHKFSSPQHKFKIKMASFQKSHDAGAVDDSRKHHIEAAIVRIMKSRKTLGHAELVAEVMQQCGNLFKPMPRQIKTSIGDLIGREYLERDEELANTYNYLA